MTTPEQEQQQYIVRLVMRVDAKPGQPDDAVASFVEMMTSNGLRDWVYRVETLDGEILGYYDGYGDPVDLATAPDAQATDQPDQTAVETQPESDSELVALAESLNDQ